MSLERIKLRSLRKSRCEVERFGTGIYVEDEISRGRLSHVVRIVHEDLLQELRTAGASKPNGAEAKFTTWKFLNGG